ncbi:MAG: DnaJ domain-containing protein [Clostridiaceae bacterium]|nr:DnaJ domain-containing protein [Clostridiaceae bacterium]
MIFKDYYKILELETNKVNIDEIKIAFREQAKKYHPDVNTEKEAEERFKDINEAYRILSNTTSKKKYDRVWYSHVGKKIDKQKDSEEREQRPDLWSLLFGINKINRKQEEKMNKKVIAKGDNVETEITLKIQEAFYGINKKISLRAVDGKMKSFSIQVPAGIRNGEKIRLIGQGKQGINGGKNGDLLIKINIENDKKYRLKGYDIYTDLILSPWEAVLGTRAKVNTIDGDTNIYIPNGISSGEKIRIQAKGYKDGKGGRGDLVAEIKIVVPKKPTEQEIELYKKLKEIDKSEPTT